MEESVKSRIYPSSPSPSPCDERGVIKITRKKNAILCAMLTTVFNGGNNVRLRQPWIRRRGRGRRGWGELLRSRGSDNEAISSKGGFYVRRLDYTASIKVGRLI